MGQRVVLFVGRVERSRDAESLRRRGVEVVGIATDEAEIERIIEIDQPDVVVAELEALGGDPSGVVTACSVGSHRPGFVAVAAEDEGHRLAVLIEAGVRGFAVRGDTDEVVAAIDGVAAGGGYLSARFVRPILDEVARVRARDRARAQELEELVTELQELSVTDWLTGLKNHGYFFERLADELERALRYRRPLSVVIGDIDDFKLINDTRGHAAGDRVLQEVAATMAATLRAADLVCRIGGEEFAMLLPETDAGGARLVAERVREQIAGLTIPGIGTVTVSLGVAAVPEHAVDRDELMEAADRALYLAMRDGKNRVRLAGDIVALERPPGAGPKRGRDHVVDLMLRVLRLRRPDLAVHAERRADVAVALGAQVGLGTAALEHLRVAALLQDLGMIGVPDDILAKPGPLTAAEWEVVWEHPKRGFELVASLVHPEAGEAILASHERWDGSGYPRRLQGEDIPMPARVLLVADTLTAMLAERPYRPARTEKEALTEIRRDAGSRYDPVVVEALTGLVAAVRGATVVAS